MKYNNLESIKKKSIPIYNLLHNLRSEEEKIFNYDVNQRHSEIYLSKNSKTKVYTTSISKRSLEAALICDEILSGNHDEYIIIGVGNSEILKQLTKKVNEDAKLHIIEFSEVIEILLDNDDLRSVDFSRINNLALMTNSGDLSNFIDFILSKNNMHTKVFVLPQYQRILPEKIELISSQLKNAIMKKREKISIDMSYQKLWIFNSIINLKHVLSTRAFAELSENDFSNSVALLVGAGPSLTYELDLLEEISKSKKCYIFAIGSAYKALLKRKIDIDVIFTYDPTPLNADVLEEYFEAEKKPPLCFGSSVGFESIRDIDYSNAYHLITSQDYFGGYILEGKQQDIVLDAPSIVVIAMQALVRIGFKNITFLGQNLGFLKEENYAEGINYKRLEGKKFISDLQIEDVFGEKIYTSSGYKRTLSTIENFINVNTDVSFMNTTHGGAAIEGAPFKALKDMDFGNYKKTFDFSKNIANESYNKQNAKLRYDKLVQEQNKFLMLLEEGLNTLLQIREGLDSKRIQNVDFILNLERIYNQISKNQYFEILISKLDRNYTNIFESSVVEINKEKDIYKKHEMLFIKMKTLLELYKIDDENVNKLFEYISKYNIWE